GTECSANRSHAQSNEYFEHKSHLPPKVPITANSEVRHWRDYIRKFSAIQHEHCDKKILDDESAIVARLMELYDSLTKK
ncbi:MAG: hypothetical protein IKT98_03285, partial [Selenomonadaceae bacterium]|nr:hypothetical protein [Selenomonadaceae bacterium]